MTDGTGRVIRVAVGQYAPYSRQIRANVDRTLALLERAASAGAHWLVLPELFLPGYQVTDLEGIALPGDDPLLAALSERAQGLGLGFQVGFAERSGPAVYDSVLTVIPGGRGHIYRKAHLFGSEVGAYARGASLPIIAAPAVTVAPLVCYDLEFPEPARSAAARGATLILVSTANMYPYADQQVLFARTRALENRIFVAVANRVGEESGFEFCGNSIVANPYGHVLVHAGPTEEGMWVADCDLNVVSEAAEDGDYLADARTDLSPVAIDLTSPSSVSASE